MPYNPIVIGGGTEATAQRVTIADDSTGVLSVDDNGSSLTVDDGGSSLTIDGTVAATQSGTWVLGANSGVDVGDVTINNAAGGSAVNIQDGGNSITVDGTVSISGTVTTGQVPVTSGGLVVFHLVSAATTNATNIKASAGQVYGWYIYNSNASARKVAFHNTAGTPTAGASVFFTLVIPPTSGANVHMGTGITFSTGIAITTVTGLADTDSTAVGLNDLNINIFYK